VEESYVEDFEDEVDGERSEDEFFVAGLSRHVVGSLAVDALNEGETDNCNSSGGKLESKEGNVVIVIVETKPFVSFHQGCMTVRDRR